MSMEPEIWQVDVQGKIYDTNLDELIQWIGEGAVAREDRVRRGNLRWLEAGKVPKLISFFNQNDLKVPPPIVPSINSTAAAEHAQPFSGSFNTNTLPAETSGISPAANTGQFAQAANAAGLQTGTAANRFDRETKTVTSPHGCQSHPDREPEFVCEGCGGNFCASCPKSYGGTVRTCPQCGSLCRKIKEIQAERAGEFHFRGIMSEGFGFSDFGAALAYPLQHKTSLISGGILFMLFTIGRSAASFGGIYMIFAALFCAMLANTLTFGILANTVNNFSQGLTNRNFMPSFDDFELWDDVIHPFFLSIGVYLVSFGLLLVLGVGAAWYLASTISAGVPSGRNVSLKTMPGPEPGDAPLVGRAVPEDDGGDELSADGGIPADDALTAAQNNAQKEEAQMQQIQKMINAQRKNQLESAVGQDPAAASGRIREMITGLLAFAVPFLMLAGIFTLWGLFYLPAACLVAGYTRSFRATINPLNGLDTIKRLGADYFKILLMTFILMVFSGVIAGGLNVILSPFNLPVMGNLPAIALGSFATFYFSIVFSVLLGYAVFKNSAKFNFFGSRN